MFFSSEKLFGIMVLLLRRRGRRTIDIETSPLYHLNIQKKEQKKIMLFLRRTHGI